MNIISLALIASLPSVSELPSLPCPNELGDNTLCIEGECKGLHKNLPYRENQIRIMNGKTIIGKIDVTKIDKDKLFKGKKGTYLDVVYIPTPDSKYGDDYMIVQGLSKEDRDNNLKGEILGNAKFSKGKAQDTGRPANTEEVEEEEDVPF